MVLLKRMARPDHLVTLRRGRLQAQVHVMIAMDGHLNAAGGQALHGQGMARQGHGRGWKTGRRLMPRQDLDDHAQGARETTRGQPQAGKQHRQAPRHMPEAFGSKQMREYTSVQRSCHLWVRIEHEGHGGQR